MVKVSVILPVYNEEPYLRQCLDSICNQTLKEIEIICIDDGSTDRSFSILQDYEKSDNRIKVLTQKNQYAGVARNYGMQKATGKYLLFLDSDDFFEPDMIEKMYCRAEVDTLDITLCHYYLYNDLYHEKKAVNFLRKDSYYPKDKIVFSGKDMKCGGIFQATVGWAWDKLFRADFVKGCGYQFPDFRSSEDGFFVYMLMARAKRIGLVAECLVFHRIYNFNSLSNTKEQNWENGFKMLLLIWEELHRQNLYSMYGQSFVSIAIEFQLYYLKSMKQKKAFYSCYQYIREVMEPEIRCMEFREDYLCTKEELEQYEQVLNRPIEDFLFIFLREKEDALIKSSGKGWVFPYHLVPKNCSLILYGAGTIGREYFDQLEQTGYCSRVRLVDQKYEEYKGADRKVESPQILKGRDFDYILISIRDKSVQTKVNEWLQSIGIKESQIISIG